MAASRTRAPAPARKSARKKRTGKPASKPPAARRYNATPELMARVRDRFEHSDDTVAAIAADLGCVTQTVYKLAAREGWVRYVPPPRDLPRASRLLAKAEALEKAIGQGTLPANSAATPTPDPSPQGGGEITAASGEDAEAERAARAARMIDDLEREVAAELAAARTLRQQLMGMPRRVRDGETTARTLAGLSQTWQTLQRMRCTLPQSRPNDDDDMPRDIDEFRRELARRIRAFVSERRARADAERQSVAPPVDES